MSTDVDRAAQGQQQPPAGSPPATQQGDTGGAKTYTQDDLDRVLRGSGTKIKELEQQVAEMAKAIGERKAADEAAERKRMEESGQHKELADRAAAERDALKAKLEDLQKRETERVGRVADANKKRAEALPKALRDLIPGGLDPDATSEQLAKLEALAGSKTIDIVGTGGRNAGPQNPAEELKAIHGRIFQRRSEQ